MDLIVFKLRPRVASGRGDVDWVGTLLDIKHL
jgi:hypothetical protein